MPHGIQLQVDGYKCTGMGLSRHSESNVIHIDQLIVSDSWGPAKMVICIVSGFTEDCKVNKTGSCLLIGDIVLEKS